MHPAHIPSIHVATIRHDVAAASADRACVAVSEMRQQRLTKGVHAERARNTVDANRGMA
jgi:hypothetical protein